MSFVVVLAIAAGVLGLAVGSFLNVVIHRVPRGESVVSPPSHCPRCHSRIRSRHNVPVFGWLVLRGRCFDCELPISARYPLVEAATGALFVAVTLCFGVTATLPAYLYLATVVVTVAMIDVDLRRVPSAVVRPSLIVAAVLLATPAVVDGDWWRIARGLVGGAALVAVVFGIGAVTQRLDASAGALVAMLGLYLGWLSWTALLLGVLATAALSGADAAAGASSEADPGGPVAVAVACRTRVPLAACLCAATIVVVLSTASASGLPALR
ncbi:prepilin peptidase [uncultured Jatrophihabitans sp.]|uniref:prepilin peptidase n=1 Tax=uncultured Jatrophihabitans sp. TaxID=1610747 RepID=UPI0035C97FA0